MTTNRLLEPERWTDRRSRGASVEDLLGAALRGARAATAPSEALLARLEVGLSVDAPVSFEVGRWRAAVVVLAALLAIGGTVGAARGPLRVWAVRHGLLMGGSRSVAPSLPVSAARARAPSAASTAPSPVEVLAVAPPPVEPAPTETRPIAPALRAPRAPVHEDVVDPAAEEARILQGAFHRLRTEAAGAEAALAAIDEYDRRFPAGLLRTEARLARVEALLALGRRSDALSQLDAWDAAGAGLTRGARLARGELRADTGRCAEAAEDFAIVLAASADDGLGGRAAYGRASCALRAGDEAAAREALTRYLEGHPDGPHAAEAREVLARLGARSPSP
jgi:hypothetical protein